MARRDQPTSTPRYQRFGARPIAAGLNDSKNALLLQPGETPDCVNVDFDRESVASSKGQVKFNNQVAPTAGIQTGPAPNGETLEVLPGKSVPMMKYGYIPWNQSQDIGAESGRITFNGATVGSKRRQIFNGQRGGSFEISTSFRIPEDEKLFVGGKDASGYDPSATADKFLLGSDIALDEFFAIVQKGGDRMTPMSWALGVVNTGKLFDTDALGSSRPLMYDATYTSGVTTSTHADRESNYCLCFMWLDSSGWGQGEPWQMRYQLTHGGDIAIDHDAADFANKGAVSTMAYRALIIPKFVIPGRNYHVSFQLHADTGDAHGNTGTADWNNDGKIECNVVEEKEQVLETFKYDRAGSASANNIYRYKGPSDSLEYLSKYGIRWHGRDPMYLGLGYRYAPWSPQGFLPFGIDSAPVENGGFGITDQSVWSLDNYSESTTPLKTAPGSEAVPKLHTARTNTGNQKVFEVQASGLVADELGIGGATALQFATAPNTTWGAEADAFNNIAPWGRHPWCPVHGREHDQVVSDGMTVWPGVYPGKTPTTANDHPYNSEALRGYRAVLTGSSFTTGIWATKKWHGAMFSVERVDHFEDDGNQADPYSGEAHYGYLQAEHDIWQDTNTETWTGAYTSGDDLHQNIVLRCFRWNQRPLVISDFRIYNTPRSSTADGFELDLVRIPQTITGLPGIANLAGHWPLDDASYDYLEDRIAGNHGYLAPYSAGNSKAGTRGSNELFLSGEGETLVLDFSDNPVLEGLLEDVMKTGKVGQAVEVTCRLPEEVFALPYPTNDPADPSTDEKTYRATCVAPLVSWEVKEQPTDAGQYRAPLMQLGYRLEADDTAVNENAEYFKYRMAFQPLFRGQSDEEANALISDDDIRPWNGAIASGGGQDRYNQEKDALWINNTITIQVGLEPTGTDDQYKVYIAVSPKGTINPELTDQGFGEYAFYKTLSIDRASLSRSVISIGGWWNPTGEQSAYEATNVGYLSQTSRMIVDEVRVFGVTAPGDLPASNGAETSSGKFANADSYPARSLETSELFSDLGSVSLTEGSTAVSSGTGAEFAVYTSTHKDGPDRSLVLFDNETYERRKLETLGNTFNRLYATTAATSTALTLSEPYAGTTKGSASAKTTRLIGYWNGSDRLLEDFVPLLNRKGYSMTSAADPSDAKLIPAYTNNALPGGTWYLRVLGPVVAGSSKDYTPEWVRGCKSTWDNPVLGMHGSGSKLYAGTKGCVYEVDDRWREDGPTPSIKHSLHFRAKESDTGFLLPEARDYVQCHTYNGFTAQSLGTATNLGYALEDDNTQVIYDAWVKLDKVQGIQTIAYVGKEITGTSAEDSSDTPDTSWWMRINNGLPEIALGSTAHISGGSTGPANGLFTASATTRVVPGRWTHIRWRVGKHDATNLAFPQCAVNGIPSAVNTAPLTTASKWITDASLVDADETRMYLGVAHTSTKIAATANRGAAGKRVEPDRWVGFTHALGGQLAMFKATTYATWNGTDSFDPQSADQTTAGGFCYLGDDAQRASYAQGLGYGHRLNYDGNNNVPARVQSLGSIQSEPFISLGHEMGRSSNQFSFSNFSGDTYVTNGGRPHVARRGKLTTTGMSAPASTPDVETLLETNWKEVSFVPNSAGNPDNDLTTPVDLTWGGVTTRSYKLNIPGTGYIAATDAAHAWALDEYFCFKCQVKFNRVDGRISLFSTRTSTRNGGPFVEVVDGKVRMGWYDTELQKDVYVETSKAVVETGHWYYIAVRKRFPRGGVSGDPSNAFILFDPATNWNANATGQTSIDEMSANSTSQGHYGDALVVRRFSRTDQATSGATSYDDWTGLDVKEYRQVKDTSGANGVAPWTAGSSARTFISFRPNADATFTSAMDSALGADWEDQITVPGIVWTGTVASGAAGGLITVSSTGLQFLMRDYIGMWLQIKEDSGTTHGGGKLYRVVDIHHDNATTKLTRIVKVVDEDGAAPDFSSGLTTSDKVAICCGVNLVKSPDFDVSVRPDPTAYTANVAGEALANSAINGYTQFDGEICSFAYGWYPGFAGSTLVNDKIFKVRPFEDADHKLTANGVDGSSFPSAADTFVLYASEAGFDQFGGVISPGEYHEGKPAGPVRVDGVKHSDSSANTVKAQVAVNTHVYEDDANTGHETAQPNAADVSIDLTTDESVATDEPDFQTTATVAAGTRRLRVTFYDPDSDTESYPSEELQIASPATATYNTAQSVTLLLKNLPRCLEKPTARRRVYVSTAGATTLYRVAEIDAAHGSDVAVKLDDGTLIGGSVLTYRGGQPPKCRVLAGSQQRMFYGGIEDMEDGLAFSEAYYPEMVPATQAFTIGAGQDEKITAVADFRNTLLAFKRNEIHRITAQTDAASDELLTEGDGAVSQGSVQALEDRLYFVSDRGPMLIYLADPGMQPFFVGKRIQSYFRDSIDKGALEHTYAAINRDRQQYVFTVKSAARDFQDEWFAIEYGHPKQTTVDSLVEGHRFGFYRGAFVTAFASVVRPGSGASRLVCGTLDGFAAWMDTGELQMDTHLASQGAGSFALTDTHLGYTGYQTSISATGAEADDIWADVLLESYRGTILRSTQANGTELSEAPLVGSWYSGGNWLTPPFFQLASRSGPRAVTWRNAPTETSAAGMTHHVGGIESKWSTAHFDIQTPDLEKLFHYLDVSRTGDADITVHVFRDMSSTAVGTVTLANAKDFSSEPMQGLLQQTRTVQVSFQPKRDQAGKSYEIFDVVLRLTPTDNR